VNLNEPQLMSDLCPGFHSSPLQVIWSRIPGLPLQTAAGEFRYSQRACHRSARMQATAWVEAFASALVFAVWVSMLSNFLFLTALYGLRC